MENLMDKPKCDYCDGEGLILLTHPGVEDPYERCPECGPINFGKDIELDEDGGY
jgi:hypothetical protein